MLSESWAKTTVGETCVTLQYGYTASATEERCGPRFLRITDIQNGQVAWQGVPFCKIDKDVASKYELKSGDIVFARTGGTVGKSFIISTVPEQAVFASYLIRLTPRPEVSSKYLYYFFQSASYWEQIGIKKGGLQGNVNATTLASLELHICPLNEQRRIVAKIEELFSELDKGIESLKTAREQLKVYRQAVLKHAFEGKLTAQWREENKDKLESPEQLLARIQQEREARYQQQLQDWKCAVNLWEKGGENGNKPGRPRKSYSEGIEKDFGISLPTEWASLTLGMLNTDIFDGPFGSNLKSNDYVDAGIRVIRLENIGYSEFIEDKYSYITLEKYRSLERHTVHSGDLVFSSFITDGIRVAILPDTVDLAINKADCFCIRVHGQSVRNDYLAAYLSTRSAYKQVESGIHGVGRPRINTTQLKEFSIPLCSPHEQDQIMLQIEDALSVESHLEADIDKEIMRSETLRQSILKKAFSGQLVAQDPSDESANTLLGPIQYDKAAHAAVNSKPRAGS